jgi:hypothetical protein
METSGIITPSVARVPLHTPIEVQRRIRDETNQRIAYYREHRDEIGARLQELNEEWDIERALATASSVFSLAGVALGTSSRRSRWLLLTAAVQIFYLQHAVQGWCPPLPILRRVGFRTPMEIELERCALKALREDAGENPVPPAGLDCGVATPPRAAAEA